ncbi:hypothetical protein [Mannheimia pernigra]|uniref:Uncharacterized protein n=1 Tax=Mannheimia pernigra TaxID=111844 RepID=A0A7D5HQP1_9PAST|nr:hypothetical protein [Mannheimia pernigra]QLB40514.1 hypothetical protein HV559_06320 [Mannheimia pernigra]
MRILNYVLLFTLSIGFLAHSTNAKNTNKSASQFNITKTCTNEFEDSCKIIRTKYGKKEILSKDVKLPNIQKYANNVYKVHIYCGSCTIDEFYNETLSDITAGYITYDPKTNCLIEHYENAIYARKLFTNRRYKLLNLKNYNLMQPHFYFEDNSKFLEGNMFLLKANESFPIKNFSKKFNNPCR